MIRKDPALYTALMEGKAKYTDAGVVDVMNLWGDLIKKGYFSDPSAVTIGSGANNFPPLFKQGKIAMLTWGTWFEPTLEAAGIKGGDDYGAFVTPNIDASAGNNLIFETAPWCVAAKGKRKADAIKATEWFASKDGQASWIKTTGLHLAALRRPFGQPGRQGDRRDDQVGRLQAAQPLLGGDAARHRRGRGRPVREVHAQAGRPDRRTCRRSRSRPTRAGRERGA